MKKSTITVSYDDEKLSALKLYLGQKNTSVEDELTKALNAIYMKGVPTGVREFIELRSGVVNAVKTKKPKSVSSAVADNLAVNEGEFD